MLALHARERQAELILAKATLQPDDADNVDVDDLLDMR
jgi:hypothetical protein